MVAGMPRNTFFFTILLSLLKKTILLSCICPSWHFFPLYVQKDLYIYEESLPLDLPQYIGQNGRSSVGARLPKARCVSGGERGPSLSCAPIIRICCSTRKLSLWHWLYHHLTAPLKMVHTGTSERLLVEKQTLHTKQCVLAPNTCVQLCRRQQRPRT